MDVGLLVLRVVVGSLLLGHSAQKLFGWFGGFGPRGSAGYLEGLGYRPGLLFALVAGLGEAGAGLLLALVAVAGGLAAGLATRLLRRPAPGLAPA